MNDPTKDPTKLSTGQALVHGIVMAVMWTIGAVALCVFTGLAVGIIVRTMRWVLG